VARLEDVNVVIYGRESTRFDSYNRQEFEYDPSSGEVVAKDIVHIELQANPEGPKRPGPG